MMHNSDRAGFSAEIPERDRKQLRADDSIRSGSSGGHEPVTRIESKSRMEIRVVEGRLVVVEFE
jgi:hypothetical protein